MSHSIEMMSQPLFAPQPPQDIAEPTLPLPAPAAAPPPPSASSWVPLMGGVMLVAFGFAEGIGMEASGLTSPIAIRGQMMFKLFVVLKLFIAAVGTSMIVQAVYALRSPDAFDGTRHYLKTTAGLTRVIVGTCLLGVGMGLAGSGPTLAPSQLGAGVKYAGVTICGMLLGGVLFSIFEQVASLRIDLSCQWSGHTSITSSTPSSQQQNKQNVVCLDKMFNIPYSAIAFPMGMGMLGAAIALEYAFPYETDGAKLRMGRVPPLHPTVAGIIVGLNQLPIRLISGTGQGGSTSVMQILATVSAGKLSSRHIIDNVEKSYQFLFVYVGTTLGSVAAGHLIPGFDHTIDGYDWPFCLVGGVFMIFGARVANGCTCGNGISGTSELSWHSFVGAGCIFGAAIVTTFALSGAGAEMYF
eukprot:PhM_4_TR7542/c0_g1_i1/m.40450